MISSRVMKGLWRSAPGSGISTRTINISGRLSGQSSQRATCSRGANGRHREAGKLWNHALEKYSQKASSTMVMRISPSQGPITGPSAWMPS